MSKQIVRLLPLFVTLSAGTAMAIWLWLDQDQASKDTGEKPPLVLEDYESAPEISTKSHEENQHGIKEIAGVNDSSNVITDTDKRVAELATSFMDASSAADAQDVLTVS
ncbi:MAG: hypothetical protein LC637_10950 [Xanthomonadaceae bacterium]|nr:hypothetical protein [Xanthomonadaceae bacterium]